MKRNFNIARILTNRNKMHKIEVRVLEIVS